jgi:hypothetical protein
MDNSNFSLNAKDICDIVTACASGGVTSFNYGPLNISFEPLEPEIVQVPITHHYEFADTKSETPETKEKNSDYPVDDYEFITDPVSWEEKQLKDNP